MIWLRTLPSCCILYGCPAEEPAQALGPASGDAQYLTLDLEATQQSGTKPRRPRASLKSQPANTPPSHSLNQPPPRPHRLEHTRAPVPSLLGNEDVRVDVDTRNLKRHALPRGEPHAADTPQDHRGGTEVVSWRGGQWFEPSRGGLDTDEHVEVDG